MFKQFSSKVTAPLRYWQSKANIKRFSRVLDHGQRILHSTIDPRDFSKTEKMLRSTLQLYSRWPSDQNYSLKAVRREIQAVREMPNLADVFVFHGDGHVREEAMRNLRGPLMAPVSVYAIFWRMNDWVPEIRNVSFDALNRVLPQTPAPIIVPALFAVLPHMNSWGRWSSEGSEAVRKVLTRPDVFEHVVDNLKMKRQPRLGQIFREISRNAVIDQHIEGIFVNSPLPHIRAIALDMLLSGKAHWPTGEVSRVWIDRSMGKYRLEIVHDQRAISTNIDKVDLIAKAAADSSAMVRRRSVDALIELIQNNECLDELEAIVSSLKGDPNVGVRERLLFLARTQKTL